MCATTILCMIASTKLTFIILILLESTANKYDTISVHGGQRCAVHGGQRCDAGLISAVPRGEASKPIAVSQGGG